MDYCTVQFQHQIEDLVPTVHIPRTQELIEAVWGTFQPIEVQMPRI